MDEPLRSGQLVVDKKRPKSAGRVARSVRGECSCRLLKCTLSTAKVSQKLAPHPCWDDFFSLVMRMLAGGKGDCFHDLLL